MSIAISTQQLLKVLLILSWIIFIGVCVDAGAILCNSILALTFNPANASYFWSGADLTSLLQHDSGHFLVLTAMMTIVAVLKTIMFYLIVKVLHDTKLNLAQPFNEILINFMSMMVYLSLAIGFFSAFGTEYTDRFTQEGIKMPVVEQLGFAGADVWFFMGVTLFVVKQIFKRGAEIQAEHELTV